MGRGAQPIPCPERSGTCWERCALFEHAVAIPDHECTRIGSSRYPTQTTSLSSVEQLHVDHGLIMLLVSPEFDIRFTPSGVQIGLLNNTLVP